jgi:hypothetical protein
MDKNYRMSKQLKVQLALGNFKSKEDRNIFKKAMVKAEHESRFAPRATLSKVDKNAND